MKCVVTQESLFLGQRNWHVSQNSCCSNYKEEKLKTDLFGAREDRGRGGPRPLLASDTPAAPGGLPYRLGKPRATPGWQFWCEPPPTRSDRSQGRQGQRAGVGEWVG